MHNIFVITFKRASSNFAPASACNLIFGQSLSLFLRMLEGVF